MSAARNAVTYIALVLAACAAPPAPSTPSSAESPKTLPEGTPVGHKTGTGWRSFNDVGLITLPSGEHLIIALLLSAKHRI